MDQAGLHNISVAQDRDQGVVTLTGKVATDGDKAKADSIANSMAGGQVVVDEIAVLPPGRGKRRAYGEHRSRQGD
jgi:osmotically-inducible protein OsmY